MIEELEEFPQQTFSKFVNSANVPRWLHEHIEWVEFVDTNWQPSVVHCTTLQREDEKRKHWDLFTFRTFSNRHKLAFDSMHSNDEIRFEYLHSLDLSVKNKQLPIDYLINLFEWWRISIEICHRECSRLETRSTRSHPNFEIEFFSNQLRILRMNTSYSLREQTIVAYQDENVSKWMISISEVFSNRDIPSV